MGIEARELFLRASQGKPRIVAKYDYCDEKGMLLYQKLRYEPKNFRCTPGGIRSLSLCGPPSI
jgi:hypothetical protein